MGDYFLKDKRVLIGYQTSPFFQYFQASILLPTIPIEKVGTYVSLLSENVKTYGIQYNAENDDSLFIDGVITYRYIIIFPIPSYLALQWIHTIFTNYLFF